MVPEGTYIEHRCQECHIYIRYRIRPDEYEAPTTETFKHARAAAIGHYDVEHPDIDLPTKLTLIRSVY